MKVQTRKYGPEPAFPQPYPPQSFEKAMVFIDGSNLFNRLLSAQLSVPKILPLVQLAANQRQLLRAGLYTTERKLIAARNAHGDDVADGVRPIFGDSIEGGGGNLREKGVDALLVADLVYHAAQRNCQYITLISNDSDFRFALNRAADFGCRVGLMALCENAPERLRNEADDYWFLTREWLIDNQIGIAA
ncbi:MAG: NYN domain-containing protein [Nitrospiraceae bacterium]